MTAEILIAAIPKNAIEELRVELTEYRGHHLVQARIWANYDSATTPKRPTRKGFALTVERLPDLIAALKDAERRARDLGMLDIVKDRA